MVIFTNCKMRILLICTSKIHRFWNLPFQPSSLLAWPWETRCKEEGIHFLAWVGGVGTAGSHCPASATNWYYQLYFSDISIPVHVFWSLWCQKKGWIIKHFALWPCCKVCLAHCVPAELDTLHLSRYTQRGCLLSQLLWAPSLGTGKRETCFHSAIELLVEYLSQVT